MCLLYRSVWFCGFGNPLKDRILDTVYVQGFSTQSFFYISTVTFYSLHLISNNNNKVHAFIKISKHRNINRYWTNNFPNFCICALKILREVISQNHYRSEEDWENMFSDVEVIFAGDPERISGPLDGKRFNSETLT